jgi:hypothetical protein
VAVKILLARLLLAMARTARAAQVKLKRVEKKQSDELVMRVNINLVGVWFGRGCQG